MRRLNFDRAARRSTSLDSLAGGFRAPSTPRMVVQVYDGGDMPTEPNRVYLCRPVSVVVATPRENEPFSASVDSDRSIPVLFLNVAPADGDYAVAHRVGGVWVASQPETEENICKLCGMEDTIEFMLTFTFSEGLIATGYGTRSVEGTGDDVTFSWSIIPGSPDDDYAGFGVDPAEFTLPIGFLRCSKDGAFARFYGLRTTTEDDPDPTNAITPDVELDSSHIVSCDPLYIVWSGELPLRRPLDHIGNLIGFEAQATL